MSDVTRILDQISAGNASASEQLLPLVYDELRKLAAARVAREHPGHSLQATALVHEAYMRLVDSGQEREWDSRGHFFAAAAEAMRRILIDEARKKAAVKRGGNLRRIDLDSSELARKASPESMLMIDEAIDRLAEEEPVASDLVKLRYFTGLSIEDAAKAVGISTRSAYRQWTYARAWRCKELITEE